ncbi:ABC transporter ATP-binding protein [Nocardioides sp.]|uniref:ABC transporter ATP-binding protein n=1 Tax=Nocardioides sp. TaxID=35761 RepID=UPI0039E3C076
MTITSEDRTSVRVGDLSIGFAGPDQAPLVSDVSFTIDRGEVFALVGESGSGKSITSKAIVGLLPDAARIGGRIEVSGASIADLTPQQLRELRSRKIGYVFQDPHRALNPARTVSSQLTEILRVNAGLGREAAKTRAAELLDLVGISVDTHGGSFPHELSGGLAQRVMIAMAVACDPDVVIADEPTSALDVSLQAQIMRLLTSLCKERDASLLVISHDLAVVADVADTVAVMFAGHIIERGPAGEVLRSPRHPYTEALREAALSHAERRDWTAVRPAEPGTPGDWQDGCAFRQRCLRATETCGSATPRLEPATATRHVACFHPLESDSTDVFVLEGV